MMNVEVRDDEEALGYAYYLNVFMFITNCAPTVRIFHINTPYILCVYNNNIIANIMYNTHKKMDSLPETWERCIIGNL